MSGRSPETSGPAQVEWKVRFEGDADPGEEGADGDYPHLAQPAPAQTTRIHLLQSIGLICLLLLLAGYIFWEEAAARLQSPPSQPSAPAVQRGDALAVITRDTTLTEHLRVYASGPDVAVVAAGAGEMERIYAETHAALGLPVGRLVGAPDGRLFVFVQGRQPVRWERSAGHIFLPSPTGLADSAHLSQAALLRQSWAIAMGDGAVLEVGERYTVPYGWLPLLNGLRLWLLWDGGGPLTVGKERIVAWLAQPERRGLSLEEAVDICRAFSLWRLSPLDYAIPVGCDQSGYFLPSPVPLPTTLVGIAPIYPPNDSLSEQFTPNWKVENKAVAIAVSLLFDYASERYGRDSLARFFSALAAHDNWDTLIPAVYGVSAQEFEAGWQAWLAEQYGP